MYDGLSVCRAGYEGTGFGSSDAVECLACVLVLFLVSYDGNVGCANGTKAPVRLRYMRSNGVEERGICYLESFLVNRSTNKR